MPTKQKRAKKENRQSSEIEKRIEDTFEGEDVLSHWLEFSRYNTSTPRTFRLTEASAYFLECLAVQLNTSPSRVLSELLDDLVPLFAEDDPEMKIGLLEHYQVMKRASVLHKADLQELKIKVLGCKMHDSTHDSGENPG